MIMKLTNVKQCGISIITIGSDNHCNHRSKPMDTIWSGMEGQPWSNTEYRTHWQHAKHHKERVYCSKYLWILYYICGSTTVFIYKCIYSLGVVSYFEYLKRRLGDHKRSMTPMCWQKCTHACCYINTSYRFAIGCQFYSPLTPRKPRSPLIIIGDRGLLRVNRL